MSIREKMNKHPMASTVITIVGLAAGLYLVIWAQRFFGPPSIAVTKAYYTTDEGKTYFADDLDKIYPFDHGGKQAYRAVVFRCNHDEKPFVVAIMRINDAGRSKFAEYYSKSSKERQPHEEDRILEDA